MENIKLKYDTDEIDVTLPKSISSSGWWLVENNVSLSSANQHFAQRPINQFAYFQRHDIK
jgi:hypothetical protein